MKKLFCLILAVCMMATVLAGCAGDTTTNGGSTNTNTGNTNTNTGDTNTGSTDIVVPDGNIGSTEGSGMEEENERPLIGWYFMDPVTTNYYGAMMDVDFWNWSLVGGLGVYNLPTGGYEPGYFTEWSCNEDQSEWTITIHPDAKWSDGEDLTVDDVIFSKDYFVTQRDKFDPNMRMQWMCPFEFTIEKISDKQFKCVSENPMPDFIGQWAMPYCEVLPQHIWEGIDPSVFLTCDEAQAPIGAGPYVWNEYVPGQYISFTANPYYYNGEPIIKDLMFLIITDWTAGALALENGDIDYNTFLEPADYVRITSMDGIEGFISHMNTHRAWKFNLTTVPVEVRQACNYFVDKEMWNNQFYGGLGDILYSCFPRGVQYQTDEGLTYYEYNIAAGQKILEDAGYTKGADGFYQKDGKTVDLEVLYATGSNDADALFLQEQLQAGGIKVTLKGLTGSERSAAVRAFEYDITSGGAALTSAASEWDLNYYASWDENPEYIKDKFAEAAATTDEALKAKLYHEIDVELNQDAVFIFGIQEHSAVAKKVGLDLSEAIVSQTYGFVHWEKLHWD